MIMVDEPIIKPSKYIRKRKKEKKEKNEMLKLKSASDILTTVAPATPCILSHISSKEVKMDDIDIKEESVLDANLLSFFENTSSDTSTGTEDTESINSDENDASLVCFSVFVQKRNLFMHYNL